MVYFKWIQFISNYSRKVIILSKQLQSCQDDVVWRPLQNNILLEKIFLDEYISSDENYAHICINDAKAMIGHNTGAIVKIRDKAKN